MSGDLAQSQSLTCFSTHQGIYRYKRLFFGVSSAAEVFQNTLTQLLLPVEKADPLMDDILVFGKDVADHDLALEATLKTLQEHNLTVNEKKCDLYLEEVEFYGTILSKEGMKPDPKRIKAILEMTDPQDVKLLRSFLGTVGYLMRFLPEFSTIVEPLRRLTRKEVEWTWGQEQKDAMNKLKERLTKVPILQYFDPQKETRLWVDASPVGLGAVLLQRPDPSHDYQPVAFASRTLSEVEGRYAQIEKEALAAIWACQRFRMYLLGKPFDLITDHKPLELIFRNNKELRSPRISRMILKMQEYACVVKHKPGAENIADYLSRSPVEKRTDKDDHEENLLEANCVFILQHSLPNAITLQSLATECSKDRVFTKVQGILEASSNWTEEPDWTDEELIIFKALSKVKLDLSLVNGLLLKKQNIVIPKSLCQQVIRLAHEGHQGVVKTKRLLRSKVWFPNLDKMVEKELSTCTVCKSLGLPEKHHPLQMTTLPSAAWQDLAVDFCGPLPNGKYLLVLVDEYSRYPVISTITSTSSMVTITHLRRIFSMFGFPSRLKSDNGPPFFSKDFKSFMQQTGIQHCRITPEWPQANGTVERLMRSIKRVLQASRIEGKNWEVELEQWSRNYRATPHSTTGESPFELLFNRKMQVLIPHIDVSSQESVNQNHQTHARAREQDMSMKDKAKRYADNRRKAQENPLQIGDKVLFRQKQQAKWDPPFDPLPWTVTDIKGTFILVERGGRRIGRNRSFFKKIHDCEPTRADQVYRTGIDWDCARSPDIPPGDQLEDNQGEPHQPNSEDNQGEPHQPNNVEEHRPLCQRYSLRNRQTLTPRSRLIEEID